jgi:hypothetical protein
MPDYMREVGGFVRVLSIVTLFLGTLICGTLLLLVVGILLSGTFRFAGGVPVWPSALLFGFLTFASGWMLVRILTRARSANGVTMMPTWFIQLFGVAFAVGIIFVAIARKEPFILLELFGVVPAMIGARWLLRKKWSKEGEPPLQEAVGGDETD